MTRPLNAAELEDAYTAIADAIDSVGPERERVFLAKLVLLLAQEMGRPQRISELIDIAKRDLPEHDIGPD